MFRNPRTSQEIRVSLAHEADYGIRIRVARLKLPTKLSDLEPSSSRNRSWKEFRRTQYCD